MALLVTIDPAYAIVGGDFYDTIETYHSQQTNFLDIVRSILPSSWNMHIRGTWCRCQPGERLVSEDRWTIQLSALLRDVPTILSHATHICMRERLAFSFVVDPTAFLLVNSNRWRGAGANTLLSIYPESREAFLRTIDELARVLAAYSGPSIVSDRRLGGQGVVHYRYGLDRDARPPDGRDDPLPAGPPPFTSTGRALKGGRYVVEGALARFNSGGLYAARDNETGQPVLVKEARSHTAQTLDGTDAVSLLTHEHHMMMSLRGERVGPFPLDLFSDGENHYLVKERLPGMPLRGYLAPNSLSTRVRPSATDAHEFYSRYCALHLRIAERVSAIHRHGIYLCDALSQANITVSPDDAVHFIDFAACRRIEDPVASQSISEKQGVEADARAFGNLLVAGIMHINGVFDLDSGAYHRFLDAYVNDLAMPAPLADAIRRLLEPCAGKSTSLESAIAALRQHYVVKRPYTNTSRTAMSHSVDEAVSRTAAAIEANATYARTDRLFPSDPALFRTNPMSVAWGSAGVALALSQATGKVPSRAIDWTLARLSANDAVSPGLYSGLSGIAWALLEMGQRDEAVTLLERAGREEFRPGCPDLFDGAAGRGLAQLKFFLATGDERYLEAARGAGTLVIQTKHVDQHGCYWSPSGKVGCGLAHGTSGISLFLLYLYLATHDEDYLETGELAINWVISKARQSRAGALTWLPQEGGAPTTTPYWRWGSAGIGMVLLRYFRVLRTARLQNALDGTIIDADRQFTIFAGRFFGLAGIGEFLLDLQQCGYGSSDQLSAMLDKVQAGLALFAIERPDGLLWPGEGNVRASCDYGTGSAGVMMHLDRRRKGNPAPFMLDELVVASPVA